MRSLGIEGAWALEPKVFPDERGSFHEWYRGAEFREATGYDLSLAQANCSVSRWGVLRGVHFSDVPPGQAKYVTCLRGAVLDVVVDIRVGSPTFGRWEAMRLDDSSAWKGIARQLEHLNEPAPAPTHRTGHGQVH